MVPSSSITPSFFGMSSTICCSVIYRSVLRSTAWSGRPGNLRLVAVDLVRWSVVTHPGHASDPLLRANSAMIGQPRGTTKRNPRWVDTPV